MRNWTDLFDESSLLLYEDAQFIILNKPAGVNSQADQTGDLSLHEWLEQRKNAKFHLVNRLDRPVSGIVLFSKNKMGNKLVSAQSVLKKSYLAITTPVSKKSQHLDHFIKRDGRSKKAFVAAEIKNGYLPCSLEYNLLHELDNYHLLSISAFSGRFHQIRAQLAFIGVHIRGDVKYGYKRANKDRSIDLHAYKMKIPTVKDEIVAVPVGREKIWEHLISSHVL